MNPIIYLIINSIYNNMYSVTLRGYDIVYIVSSFIGI